MFWKRSRSQSRHSKRHLSLHHRLTIEPLEERIAPAVDFAVVNDWGSGFQASIDIQNTESTAVSGWELEFDFPHNINSLWNGTIVSHQNDHYIVRDAGYNADIAPGATRTIGFTANFNGTGSEPTNYVFNGSAVGEPQPPTPPDISVADVDVSEGDGQSEIQFVITLSQAFGEAVTVNYATSDGSALAGDDYLHTSGSLVFAPREIEKIVSVTLLGDDVVENDENFFLNLSNAAGGNLIDDQAEAMIRNDDAPPVIPPDVAIADTVVVEGNPGAMAQGNFHTSGNQIIDANGQSVRIAGVNWFGFETTTFAPHGLWARNWQSMMDQMAGEGFNTIRLPFSNQLFDAGSTPNGINFGLNPDLQELSGIQIMDKIVDYAGEIGLRIILDNHRSSAGDGPNGSGLWYDNNYPESRWISDWVMLATRYAGNPTVIGADLANEPHNAANWGTGDANDWRLATERAGNAVLAVNPDWLIIVEGIQHGSSGSYWWGGNLSNAGHFPVRLNVADRLVYSAHDYPASVFAQDWFNAPNYPNNLVDIWDANWGYLFRQNIAPVLLGEFGSRLETASDQLWLNEMIDYLGGDLDGDGVGDLAPDSLGVSWTWWSWNPNSGDTGGILQNDWQTVIRDKVDQLAPVQFAFGETGSATTALFTVTLSQPATHSVTVDFTTADGNALAGVDYVAASGTLIFAPGETQKTIAVTILSDAILENEESFFVRLTGIQGGVIIDGEAAGTIIDDDTQVSLPQMSVGDVSVVEGDSGQQYAEFVVTLSTPSQDTVTVAYATANADADAGVDYAPVSGMLTFAPGETTLVVQVPVFGDEHVEGNEQFLLTLSDANGVTLQRAQATGTIVNDDTPPASGDIDFTVVNNWGTGFQGQITVNNTAAEPLTHWVLEFDADFEIIDIWNAVIVSHVGNHYVIRAASWNTTSVSIF